MPHRAAPTTSNAVGAIPHVSVSVASLSEAPPQLETDESYELHIPADGELTL